MRDERIDFHYLTDIAGIHSQTFPGGIEVHNLVIGYMPSQQPDVVAGNLFRIASGNTKKSRQNAARFTDLIKPINHDGFNQDAALFIISTDAAMVDRSVRRLLNVVAPEYISPSPPVFKIKKAENGIVVESNLDFTSLNAAYNKSISSEISSLSDKLILSHLQESLITAHFSAKLNSEVAVNPLEQAIYSQAIESLVQRHSKSKEQIEAFTEMTLPVTYSIREMVNSGKVKFSEVVQLLDKAGRFKAWLKDKPPDGNLLKEFYNATVKSTWIEKLPTKTTRWAIFTGIGFAIDVLATGGIGTAAGLAVSLFDTFVLDKIASGWKPHQFIEGPFKATFSGKAPSS